MYNFEFQNPVKLIFGKGSIARIAEEIPAQSKIMLTFGGGSVKRNGVYDQVIKALEGRNVVEFWGIEPNPKYETLVEAIATWDSMVCLRPSLCWQSAAAR